MGHRLNSHRHFPKLHWTSPHSLLLGCYRSSLLSVSQRICLLLLLPFTRYDSGALYLLSIFYTRREVATRMAILYTGNILATAFAGLIAIGIFKMDGVAGLEGWRWLFIIQGIVTFIVAIIGVWFLPDDPLGMSLTSLLRLRSDTPRSNPMAHTRRAHSRQRTHQARYGRGIRKDHTSPGSQGSPFGLSHLGFHFHATHASGLQWI